MRAPFPILALSILAPAGCASGDLPGPGTLAIPDDDDGGSPEEVAAAEALYDPAHVVEVAVEIAPADAEALASETQDIFDLLAGADCMDRPWEGPFSWYEAGVTVDGVLLPRSGIRKKGLIGSLSAEKPSVKIKFDKWISGQTFRGLERMTLNNSISDPSLVRQCLGYRLFRDAGLEAPRCNFAHVVANGSDLGIYVNVEPPKGAFLRWAYDGDDGGDLYEGTLSDLRSGWIDTFEPETAETDPDHGPLLEAAAALEIADDDEAVQALSSVLDMGRFTRFWAMETLVAHVDGYTGNRNNFYVYRPEETDLLEFLPWGIDATFLPRQAFGSDTELVVMAGSALPRRLWSIPEQRDAYLEALEDLLDEVWDEGALLAEIDRMAALVEPLALPDPGRAESKQQLRSFVLDRRDAMQEVMAAPLPAFDDPLPDTLCLVENGSIALQFSTGWDTLSSADPLGMGASSMQGEIDGHPFAAEGGAIAGLDNGQIVIAPLAFTGPSIVTEVAFFVPPWAVHTGPVPVGGFGTQGFVIDVDIAPEPDAWAIRGSLWDADLVLTTFEAVPGGEVAGTYEGLVYGGGPWGR